jgi:predicted MPP superfamily phosphohydrolase
MLLLYLSPLILMTLLVLVGLRLRPPARRTWLWVALPALGCDLFDALLLWSLPRLGLSFGPIDVPLFLFGLGRLAALLPAMLFLAFPRKHPAGWLPILSGAVQLGLALAAFDGLALEPFRLTVSQLSLPQAPAFFPDRPLRILHLTDLHVEHPTRRETEMLRRAVELHPDLILLTGDYLNPTYMDDPQAQAETRQILSQLGAPYGVYAVSGTVENPTRMAALFDGLENVHVLDDETARLSLPGGELALVGVTNTRDLGRDAAALAALAEALPDQAYSVLLYHTPDLIEAASDAGLDLYLAGHTHGGQVRLPGYGAIITFSAYGKQYEMGAYEVGPTTLYVSRGLGMEGWSAPRLRFLCPPEMVLVMLGR